MARAIAICQYLQVLPVLRRHHRTQRKAIGTNRHAQNWVMLSLMLPKHVGSAIKLEEAHAHKTTIDFFVVAAIVSTHLGNTTMWRLPGCQNRLLQLVTSSSVLNRVLQVSKLVCAWLYLIEKYLSQLLYCMYCSRPAISFVLWLDNPTTATNRSLPCT